MTDLLDLVSILGKFSGPLKLWALRTHETDP